MPRRYRDLTLLILLTTALRSIISYCPSPPGESMSFIVQSNLDAESLLARGLKISLKTADLYDLQLIKGISEEFSRRIIAQKDRIRASALALPSHKRYQALQIIKGIGPQKALKFSRDIELVP